MPHMNRRESMFRIGTSLGSVAFASLLAGDTRATESVGPLAPKPVHIPAKAKNCIFLTMTGGPSHIDTFDPKPALKKLHLQEFTRSGETKSAMESGKRYYVQSPFSFHQHGDSGAPMADNWQHLARVADDLCFFVGARLIA